MIDCVKFCNGTDCDTSCRLIRCGLFPSWKFKFVFLVFCCMTSNFMCLNFSIQISILDSHCPEPKQEVGKRILSLFLPPFLLPVMSFAKFNKAALQISPFLSMKSPPPGGEGGGGTPIIISGAWGCAARLSQEWCYVRKDVYVALPGCVSVVVTDWVSFAVMLFTIRLVLSLSTFVGWF